jgi:hypothetical protein
VKLCKFKGSSVKAGNKLRVIARVKNYSASASGATKVQFVLSDDGTVPSPPSTVETLGTISIPAINPNKSKRVSKKFKVPEWVTPDKYYVVAIVDPDDQLDEGDEDNNVKASKKQVTVK